MLGRTYPVLPTSKGLFPGSEFLFGAQNRLPGAKMEDDDYWGFLSKPERVNILT